ncbi:MAG: nitrous oxide reductase family maturation protein NosD [Ignavibacteriales bacterium]|nr:nitrous oxide reductase family maturation protein NosD [Ignavibacteriales bacterium]
MKALIQYCAVLLSIVSPWLFAKTYAVQNGKSIQSVLNIVQKSDTLIIEEGVYHGNLLLTKPLSLLGTGKAIIVGDGAGSIITILADSCVVRGLTIEHCGAMLVNEDAGILVKSRYNIIEQNHLRDILFGIYLLQSDANTVANNVIEGRTELEQGERGSGIHLWNSHRNTLSRNTISWTRDGLYIQNANHTLIKENEVHSLRYGVHYMYADSNIFLRNSFHDNVAGAAIMYSRGIVMKHNLFLRNRGFASYGILFQDCHFAAADSNVIVDNVVGIFMESSTDNFFRANIIAQNDAALQMFQNSVNNTFTENNFIDNLNLLTIVGKRTESRWNCEGKGNYWSTYDGYDVDANGIGDVPMKIQNVFNYLEGKNPNVRLYLYSPASQALAVSAKAFPIIDLNNEMDSLPLMSPVDMRWAAEVLKRFDLPPGVQKYESPAALGTLISIFGFCVVGFAMVRVKKAMRRTL